MPTHVVFRCKQLATVRTLEFPAFHSMHILVMLVKISLVVCPVLTKLTLELLWLVREVGVIMDLSQERRSGLQNIFHMQDFFSKIQFCIVFELLLIHNSL